MSRTSAADAEHTRIGDGFSPEVPTGNPELVASYARAYSLRDPIINNVVPPRLEASMLEAHIVSARGTLYYAGEAHPYDLEMLWEHVRDASGDVGHAVQLELVVHDRGVDPPIGEWIRRVTRQGVRVQLSFSRASDARGETDESHVALV